MTKDNALHAWFSQFLPSYPTSNVPEDATFPWLTYELITGSWESGEIALTQDIVMHRKTPLLRIGGRARRQ